MATILAIRFTRNPPPYHHYHRRRRPRPVSPMSAQSQFRPRSKLLSLSFRPALRRAVRMMRRLTNLRTRMKTAMAMKIALTMTIVTRIARTEILLMRARMNQRATTMRTTFRRHSPRPNQAHHRLPISLTLPLLRPADCCRPSRLPLVPRLILSPPPLPRRPRVVAP